MLLRAVASAEAPRIHVPHVERRRPLDDPLGNELAHPARTGEAVRAEARGDPEPAHVGRAEDELAVRRERLRAVDELHDLHLLERWDAHDRVLHQLLEARPVLLEELAVEVRRDPVERPRGAVALVAAHDEAARLRTEVHEERRVAHGRHLERQPARLQHEVLVRHRHDRDDHPGQRADLARIHAARVDDNLRLDLAAVGLDRLDVPAARADPRHARRGVDLGPTPTRALGERERQLARVDVAVGRQVRRAEHAVGRHRGEEHLRLRRRDQLERKAERLGPTGLPRDLLQALLRRGEPERPDLPPPGLEPHLVGRASGTGRRSPSSSASGRATSGAVRRAPPSGTSSRSSGRRARRARRLPSRAESASRGSSSRRRPRRSRPPWLCPSPGLLHWRPGGTYSAALSHVRAVTEPGSARRDPPPAPPSRGPGSPAVR